MRDGGRLGRPEVVWRLRRSRFLRRALRSIVVACLALLGVVTLITVLLVWELGHPVALGVIGFFFAVLPLSGLLLALGVGLRGAVAAGPRWIGVRIIGRWRVIDLGDVRAVRLGTETPLGGFGPFGGRTYYAFRGGRWSPATDGVHGHDGPTGPGVGGQAARLGGALVFEDASGHRIDVELDALGSGLADVVRRGLGPGVDIDPGAARALEDAGRLGRSSDATDDDRPPPDAYDTGEAHRSPGDARGTGDAQPARGADDTRNAP
jgi:hypothetical protein